MSECGQLAEDVGWRIVPLTCIYYIHAHLNVTACMQNIPHHKTLLKSLNLQQYASTVNMYREALHTWSSELEVKLNAYVCWINVCTWVTSTSYR